MCDPVKPEAHVQQPSPRTVWPLRLQGVMVQRNASREERLQGGMAAGFKA